METKLIYNILPDILYKELKEWADQNIDLIGAIPCDQQISKDYWDEKWRLFKLKTKTNN